MKNYIKLLMGFILLLTSSLSEAQTDINPKEDTIKWEYGKVENKIRSEMITLSGHFISYSDNGFLWVQNGTDRKYTFEVTSVTGDWSDINEKGELVYGAICDGIEGVIRISRSRKDLNIQLDFAKPDKLTPNIVLQINSYSKL